MVAGSGIGLFVCASLAAAMGGRIWARRRPTGGSEFGFTMRTLRSDEDNVRIPETVSSAARADPQPTMTAWTTASAAPPR